jgi:hypothetical protein
MTTQKKMRPSSKPEVFGEGYFPILRNLSQSIHPVQLRSITVPNISGSKQIFNQKGNKTMTKLFSFDTVRLRTARSLAMTAGIAAFIMLVISGPPARAQEIDQQTPFKIEGLSAHHSGAKFIYATGKEVGAPGGSTGTITCVGGQPTGLPFPFCTPETKKILIRGAIRFFNYQELAGPAAAMFAGASKFVLNCNWDQNYQGPCWGTFEWPIATMGGKWEGNFSGEIDLLKAYVNASAVGHGNGGDLDGLQMKYDILYPGGVSYGTAILRVLTKSQ